jgi:hypothetical protein
MCRPELAERAPRDDITWGENMHDNCGDRPLLGTVLIDQGAVDGSDVDDALRVQAETGKRLGEALVDLGLICRPELDRAVARQSGVDLDHEAGYGTGLRAAIERRHRYRRDFSMA